MCAARPPGPIRNTTPLIKIAAIIKAAPYAAF